MIQKAWKIIKIFIVIVIIFLALIIVSSSINIPGNIKLYTVQSGSMEPAIHVGSMVIVKPTDYYQINDVITISEQSNPDVSVTHRIIDIESTDNSTLYITKGDANESIDTEKRLEENVLGKVVFSFPLIGYIISFAKTREGLLILVILLSIIIIVSEIFNVKKEAKKLLDDRKKKFLNTDEIKTDY